MKYELLEEYADGSKVYARIDDDGLCRFTCTENDSDYQAWLANLQKGKSKAE